MKKECVGVLVFLSIILLSISFVYTEDICYSQEQQCYPEGYNYHVNTSKDSCCEGLVCAGVSEWDWDARCFDKNLFGPVEELSEVCQKEIFTDDFSTNTLLSYEQSYEGNSFFSVNWVNQKMFFDTTGNTNLYLERDIPIYFTKGSLSYDLNLTQRHGRDAIFYLYLIQDENNYYMAQIPRRFAGINYVYKIKKVVDRITADETAENFYPTFYFNDIRTLTIFVNESTIGASGGTFGPWKIDTNSENSLEIKKIKIGFTQAIGSIDNIRIKSCDSFDTDNDGILDDEDLCLDTNIPEVNVPSVKLGINRFALVNNDLTFDTVSSNGKKSYTIANTKGCNCEQILTFYKNQGENMEGHWNFGCSKSIIDEWINNN